MADSSQKFIARNRAPRVQIEYDVELYGAEKKVQLPFVMGVMSDLSGKSTVETPNVTDRKFLEIDVDNFDDRMKAMAPRVEFSVPNTLTGEGNLAVDLTFEKMADFSPAQIAARIEPLRKLLEARTQLSTLMAYMDGKTGAEALIEKILADPSLLSALADSAVPDQDHDATLNALRAEAPEDAPGDTSVDDALASLPEVQVETAEENKIEDVLASVPEIETSMEEDSSSEILSDLASSAPQEDSPDTSVADALSSIPETSAEMEHDESADVLAELANSALDEPEEGETVDDVLSAISEVAEPEDEDSSADVLSELAEAAPLDEGEDNTLDDALSSLPELEELADEDQSDDVLAELAELGNDDKAEDTSIDHALSSIPDAPEIDEDDDLDDLLADLAEASPDEADEDEVIDDVLAAMPDVEEAEETDESDDILSDLADSAPDETSDEDDELDALLSDLAEASPDETDDDEAIDDVLAAMPDVEEVEETDESDDILGDLADSAPADTSDEEDDLDAMLSDLAEMTSDEADDDETIDDVLAAMPDVDEVEETEESDEILSDLTDSASDDTSNDEDDLDAFLADLDTPSADEEGDDDLDDFLNEISVNEAESEDDLEGLLDDLSAEDISVDDLDDVLSDESDQSDSTDEDLDLEGLLDETDDTSELDDLDDLLSDIDGDESSDDLDDLLSDLDEGGSEDKAEEAEHDGEPVLAYGTMSAERPDPERLKRTRFRLAIFGDFSGRSARGQIETGNALAARKPILLDPDTVEDVIKGFATKLVLPLGKDGAGIEVDLKELDDLHPDELYEKVELFDGLAGLKGQLSTGATADHAAKQLIAWGEEFGQAVVPPRKSSGGNTVRADLKLSDFQRLIGDTTGELAQASPVEDLLKRVVGPHIRQLPSPDVSAMQAAVDDALSAAMRMVLHHPEFQSVEAQWRSLDLIARSIEDDDTLDVILYDVSAEEIAADLAAGDDLAETGLVRLLTEEPLDEENGRGGYSALIGLYTFEETPPHAELLGRIGRVAAHVDAPFISAITPTYLDIKKEDRHPLVVKAWDTLRAMPEAGHVGLASPRFLLRRPYGAKTEPIYEFDFEEFTESEGLRGMLWANPAVLVAVLLARSFKQNGKAMNLGSVMSLGGMPYYFVNDRYGDQVALPCTERNITLDKHEHSVQRGYMPLLSVKGRDEIRLGSFNSVAGQEILGPWSGVPAPAPSPDVPDAPDELEVDEAPSDDDFDLDDLGLDDEPDLDLGDDDTPDLVDDDFDLDLDDDDSGGLDGFLSAFGDDTDEDDEEELDPELAALLADL